MQAAARGFLPVAVEVGTLMESQTEAGKLFRTIAAAGHYGNAPAGRTRQGTYFASPWGAFLASGNDQNPKATLRLMNQALDAWKALPARERVSTLKPAAKGPVAGRSKAPENGLILDVSLRKFFPRPLKTTPVDAKVIAAAGLPQQLQRFARTKPETYWEVEWNQDHAWFTPDEARRLMPAKLAAGESVAVDSQLVNRLARLHLLDTVRALADAYPASAIEKADLTATVTAADADTVTVQYEGTVKLEQTGLRPFARTADQTAPVPKKPTRGYDARLLGRATYDRKRERFVSFELVALGTKTGGSKLSPFDETQMGVSFTLAAPSATDPIEPRYWSLYK